MGRGHDKVILQSNGEHYAGAPCSRNPSTHLYFQVEFLLKLVFQMADAFCTFLMLALLIFLQRLDFTTTLLQVFAQVK
jgi:hypothetical protein